ncbi:hypothetical protein [Aneurinibacillus aneurinilyticus]|uniref:hypothetical protein n=1 Tax=Aneurinibacillus aneurinilyticus TaxID=1391 RepID=UPI0023EFE284|nr:hypothetical protein [Aneurinibacillus aneurinilyticus]
MKQNKDGIGNGANDMEPKKVVVDGKTMYVNPHQCYECGVSSYDYAGFRFGIYILCHDCHHEKYGTDED